MSCCCLGIKRFVMLVLWLCWLLTRIVVFANIWIERIWKRNGVLFNNNKFKAGLRWCFLRIGAHLKNCNDFWDVVWCICIFCQHIKKYWKGTFCSFTLYLRLWSNRTYFSSEVNRFQSDIVSEEKKKREDICYIEGFWCCQHF